MLTGFERISGARFGVNLHGAAGVFSFDDINLCAEPLFGGVVSFGRTFVNPGFGATGGGIFSGGGMTLESSLKGSGYPKKKNRHLYEVNLKRIYF